MLRITFLSLLLGAAALAAGLALFFPPANSSGQQAPALVWDPSYATTLAGTSSLIDGRLQLELDSAGEGLVSLATGNSDTNDFSFIHLALEESARNLVATLIWTNAHDPEDSQSYRVESHARRSLWLATEELRGWHGDISTLGLQFSGRAGDTVLIEDFSVVPASVSRQLLTIFSDLNAYAPWNTAAMNTYTGVFNSSLFYPVVLVVALLVLSVLAYGGLVFIFRAKLYFDPTVVLLIFFACWIMLDLLWQKRLLHQLVDTHRLFAGKNTEERLAVGPDAALYGFISQTKLSMAPADSRVFVSSSDLYHRMRGAYYFYPFNVYWSHHSPALPQQNVLREGDYIVLINPSPFRFDKAHSLLVGPKRRNLRVELVFQDHTGTAVRVK